ncbi:LHFPL tetraspan sub member 6 protein [Clonorchis sinensis]|uniref:LHFPL tetraspan sub member 6 protein n=1 Tax=Clonorchis sinensis TaxID=79923 RepID=A0A419PYX8_CLOSI|nr:LHFPL tetraspan sub member 6 protein [Clonorchis sinensis]
MKMRCLWLIWSLLTWLAAILCTIGCLLPYWLKGYVHFLRPTTAAGLTSSLDLHTPESLGQTPIWKPDTNRLDTKSGIPTDLGLFRRCGYPVYVNRTAIDSTAITKGQANLAQPVVWHSGCGHYSQLTSGPHIAWHIAFLMLVSACGLLFFATFFLFILGFALYLISIRTIHRSCQIMLVVAGLLALISCVLYPVGWTGNSEVRQACGEEAYIFNLGRCHIGWAYVLTCSGGLLSLFAALLPVIFPKNANQQTGSSRSDDLFLDKAGRSSNGCQCFGKSNRQMKSATGENIPFYPGPMPSPANSLDAESVCFQSSSHRPDSMLLHPRPGGLSPTHSTSPVPSVLQDRVHPMKHEDMTGLCYVPTSSQRPPSAFIPASSVPPYPYVCSYLSNQQRYSTGALLGHYQLLPTSLIPPNLHANQRISVAVNADPLIYVSEEEELQDTSEQPADPKSGSNEQSNDGTQSNMNGERLIEPVGTSRVHEVPNSPSGESSSLCPVASTPSELSDLRQTQSPSFMNHVCAKQQMTGTQNSLPGAAIITTAKENHASFVL